MTLDVAALPAGVAARPAPDFDLATRARADGVRFLLALFVDLTGKPCAKLVPVEAADELQRAGVGFAGYAVGAMGQQPCDPDLVAIPDVASYTPLPWVREGLALVHCDPHVEGEPWRFAPRVLLTKQLERARARQLELFVGAEVEYFLVVRGADGRIVPADAKDDAARPCYDARGLTRMYDHLTGVSAAMNEMGWGNYANDHEDANGQFEQNFAYADALTTADRVITARYLISVLAEQRDMVATYMPKPFGDRTGSGLHLHMSLWRGSEALFPAGDDVDGRGHGLSPLAYSFLAGILEHAPGMQAVIAPTVNSYKRTGATSTRSGATWSPRRASYGGNDRTHFVRIPDDNRIEMRGGDGSANPYLAIAASLAAGLDGIDRGLDPDGSTGPRPTLPPTLLHAVDALTADPVVSGALDAAGPGVSEYFAALKREEFLEWHNTVGTVGGRPLPDRLLTHADSRRGMTPVCGIVGLHLRDPGLHPRLGRLLDTMLGGIVERGPDSAGVAVYGDRRRCPEGHAAVSVLDAPADLADSLPGLLPGSPRVLVTAAGDTTVVAAPVAVDDLAAAVRAAAPGALVVGTGTDLTVYKGTGHPRELARTYGLAGASGWQALAHTRMATESAVTPAGCHPFSVGVDQCLVHNGSFANHATIRRELQAQGAVFDSDNDSEVGARFVAARLAQGDDLDKALRLLCERFDGFYTLLVTSGDGFAVVRDAIACKPAIIAETPAWVAMASEFRALAQLPGIESARIYEPEPERVYAWQR